MDAAAELGRNPVSKHRIQPEYEDQQAYAGRPNSQARKGTGEYSFPCSADHEQDWQPYPGDPYSAICEDQHMYIDPYMWCSTSAFTPNPRKLSNNSNIRSTVSIESCTSCTYLYKMFSLCYI